VRARACARLQIELRAVLARHNVGSPERLRRELLDLRADGVAAHCSALRCMMWRLVAI
jgi:hypothetical protein